MNTKYSNLLYTNVFEIYNVVTFFKKDVYIRIVKFDDLNIKEKNASIWPII